MVRSRSGIKGRNEWLHIPIANDETARILAETMTREGPIPGVYMVALNMPMIFGNVNCFSMTRRALLLLHESDGADGENATEDPFHQSTMLSDWFGHFTDQVLDTSRPGFRCGYTRPSTRQS